MKERSCLIEFEQLTIAERASFRLAMKRGSLVTYDGSDWEVRGIRPVAPDGRAGRWFILVPKRHSPGPRTRK